MIRHFTSIKSITQSELDYIFETARNIEAIGVKNVPDLMRKNIMATVFFQPSTRTRFSFEAAMMRLGGNVISTENAGEFTSWAKGGSLEDEARIISGYSDVIVLRHDEDGSAEKASKVSEVPVINGGDGISEHPSQALLDLYTIEKEKGIKPGLRIAIVGDLKNGRTIHSLLYLLEMYEGLDIHLIAPPRLMLEEKMVSKRHRIHWSETLHDAGKADIIYMAREQGRNEIDIMSGYYMINKANRGFIKKDAIIMHPLPRLEEISPDMDDDPRAAYFRQAKNGLYVRMALLMLILNTPLE